MANRHQPALLGGVFIGIMSSLPLIGGLNICCCLWVVAGGMLTVYLRQNQEPQPLETADAVLAGLLAGVVGAVLFIVGTWTLLRWTGPIWQAQVTSQLESNPDLPPNIRDMMLNLMTGRGLALLQFAVTLPMYAIFSTLGALLGLSFFRKKMPPPSLPV